MFTDYRRKTNNLKLMDLLNYQFDEIKDLLNMIDEWRDVDKAEGQVLDNIGEGLNVYRGHMRDEVYRIMIKARLLSNASGGDIYTVVELINNILLLEPGEFQINEAYHKDIEEVGTVIIEEVPLRAILEAGLGFDEFVELVKATLAAGIGIAKLEVIGTFEFADELIQDSDIGFADVDMTTGGTLSEWYEEGEGGE